MESIKRLSIDMSASPHTWIKSQFALRSVKMADEVRELLKHHFREL